MATSNKNEKGGGNGNDANGSKTPRHTNASLTSQASQATQGDNVPPPTPLGETLEDEFPILPIQELPKKYQDMFQEFTNYLNQKQPQDARLALRPLIAYYIEQKREIPLSVEVGYGKLLVLEELKKLGKL